MLRVVSVFIVGIYQTLGLQITTAKDQLLPWPVALSYSLV